MTTIAHSQRCRCPIPKPSGRVYLGRHHCLRCDGFPLTGLAERHQLDLQAARADQVERAIWPTGQVPVVTVEKARAILRHHLEQSPRLSQSELRYAISVHGRYEMSESHFYQLLRKVRDEFGIVPTRGRPRAA